MLLWGKKKMSNMRCFCGISIRIWAEFIYGSFYKAFQEGREKITQSSSLSNHAITNTVAKFCLTEVEI